MIDSKLLLTDLKKQLKLLESDLRSEAKTPSGEESVKWAKELREEHQNALDRDRTARTFDDWLEGEVSQAAVAWIISCVFIRFCEDNSLIDSLWIAGPQDCTERASEAELAHYAGRPTDNARDWLSTAFGSLADLPAGRALVDRHHNLVWRAPISAEAASALLKFWRQKDEHGTLAHDFTDPKFGTRFLGDLYQDLSDYAKKTFALLQTPDFIEEFILDQTLTPAINEFGIQGLKLIDPTCGSGHFLLGAFERLHLEWETLNPGLSQRARVQNALDSIHGVDLNPFAVAIARFRLTVAALRACGETSLMTAPEFSYHLAVGDSLIAAHGRQADLFSDDEQSYEYSTEDISEYSGILTEGQYHVVVGNPPYIGIADSALRKSYKDAYPLCHGQFTLVVPFMELFFRLAINQNGLHGYIGKITANAFLKREFGKRLVENFLSGKSAQHPVDVVSIVDTSGAYIPGHTTPTLLLFGRRRWTMGSTVRIVQGVRGEPERPEIASDGLVWKEIAEHNKESGFRGRYVTVSDVSRDVLGSHPCSLTGGDAPELKQLLDDHDTQLSRYLDRAGMFGDSHAEDIFAAPRGTFQRLHCDPADIKPAIDGDETRDYSIGIPSELILHHSAIELPQVIVGTRRAMWPWRTSLWSRRQFSGETYKAAEVDWLSWHQISVDDPAARRLVFAKIATHMHVADVRHSVIEKPGVLRMELNVEHDSNIYPYLVNVLGSSAASFWLRQVSHPKDRSPEEWATRYEFTGTKLRNFPLPPQSQKTSSPVLGDLICEQAAILDRLILSWQKLSDRTSIIDGSTISGRSWYELRSRAIFEQEEMDWQVYFDYGIIDRELVYKGANKDNLDLGTRAFEIILARQVLDGEESTSWFEKHGIAPAPECPPEWPADYTEIVLARIDEIRSNPHITLIERPEYKRRWVQSPWLEQIKHALRELILNRLETASFWADAQGAACKSVAQLADVARHDAVLVEALQMLSGSAQIELVPALTELLSEESVPYLAQLRYKTPGLTNYRGWQHVWDLQRREDSGEHVDIPVPPKFKKSDFQKSSYWQARGKLDVPKERFISYPGLLRSGDTTPVFGWAGWDHAAAALALARVIAEQDAEGATAEQLTPLLAGLHELEPWVKQWHSDVDTTIGASPAAAVTGMIDAYLTRLALTRVDLGNWRPESSPARGRRRSTGVKDDQETLV